MLKFGTKNSDASDTGSHGEVASGTLPDWIPAAPHCLNLKVQKILNKRKIRNPTTPHALAVKCPR